jgi:hypothetical protein
MGAHLRALCHRTTACRKTRRKRRAPEAGRSALLTRMDNPWIQFARWSDNERDLCLFEVTASNREYLVRQQFYAYLDDIQEFGNVLKDFPLTTKDEVRFSIGARDPAQAHWLLLKAYIYDSTGHAGLLFECCDNTIDPWRQEARFTIRCEAASLNRLGKALVDWVRSGNNEMREELTAP